MDQTEARQHVSLLREGIASVERSGNFRRRSVGSLGIAALTAVALNGTNGAAVALDSIGAPSSLSASSTNVQYPGRSVGCQILEVPHTPERKIITTLRQARGSWFFTASSKDPNIEFDPSSFSFHNKSDEDGQRFQILARKIRANKHLVQYRFALKPRSPQPSLFGTQGWYEVGLSYANWRTKERANVFVYPDGTPGVDRSTVRYSQLQGLKLRTDFKIDHRSRSLDMGFSLIRQPFLGDWGYNTAISAIPTSATTCRGI